MGLGPGLIVGDTRIRAAIGTGLPYRGQPPLGSGQVTAAGSLRT